MSVTVVIRTKNEAQWLRRCLRAVSLQRGCEFDVIVVDNQSSDDSVEIAREFEVPVINILDAEFTFGRALNRGIEAAKGELVAILSGHCIPVNDRWLSRLISAFTSPSIVGVYGKQEPLPDSTAFDKRDLWTTFGLDRREHVRDWFFHNANSMIRKDVWRKVPFNEAIAGVEDRDWAKRVQAKGYRIAYEPRAAVFHHHGIHQGRDEARASRVAKVIELIRDDHV